MITITNTFKKIIINLENGIYTFSNDSATGKTYLFKLLKERTSNTKLLCITLNDVIYEVNVKALIEKNRPTLIFFDRYDRYEGKFKEIILEQIDKAIVLLDYKHGTLFNAQAKDCYIQLLQDRIEVGYDCI